MLRVTEEKERNFEKRGYMGKKVLGVLTILLVVRIWEMSQKICSR